MSGPAKILFVDDEPRVLASLKRGLRSRAKDWEMAFHDDPEAALDQFRDAATEGIAPDVAVLDIRMPKISGLDLARKIQEVSPSTVCIILSGSTDFDVAIASINESHVFRYYVKPCPIDDLAFGIEAALASRGRRRSDLAEQGLLNDQAGAASLSLDTINMLPYGVMIIGSVDRALFTNEAAAEMIAGDFAIGLNADGRCIGADSSETSRIRQAITTVRENGNSVALTLGENKAVPLHISVEPYKSKESEMPNSVCLFITHKNIRGAPPATMLAGLFGLTSSESHLSAALAKGLSLDNAASECGITKSSARTYLKNIFAKVGVSRQAELVRKLVLAAQK